MMQIIGTEERVQKTCICNGFHLRPNPSRIDKSRGSPFSFPASFIYGFSFCCSFALCRCSLTMRFRGRPLHLAVSCSHFASSSGNRSVTVTLICQKCNTKAARFQAASSRTPCPVNRTPYAGVTPADRSAPAAACRCSRCRPTSTRYRSRSRRCRPRDGRCRSAWCRRRAGGPPPRWWER